MEDAFPVDDIDESQDWSSTITITAYIDLSDYDDEVYTVKIFDSNPFVEGSKLLTTVSVDGDATTKFSIVSTHDDYVYVTADGNSGRIISRYYELDGESLYVGTAYSTRGTRSLFTRGDAPVTIGDTVDIGLNYMESTEGDETVYITYNWYTYSEEYWIEHVTENFESWGTQVLYWSDCPFEPSSILVASSDSEEEETTTETVTTQLSLSGMYGWSGTFDSSTLTATYAAEWDGMGVWLGGADWSDYSTLTVEWEVDESQTSITQLGLSVQYTSAYSNGSVATPWVSYSTGFCTIDLDSSLSNDVYQWYIQADAAGTVTFTKAYLTGETTSSGSSDDVTYTLDFSNYELVDGAEISIGYSSSSFDVILTYLNGVETWAATPWIISQGYELFGPGSFFEESVKYYYESKLELMEELYGDWQTGLDKVEAGFSITTTGGEIEIPFIYGATEYYDLFGYIYYTDDQDPLEQPHYVLMSDARPTSNIYYDSWQGTSVSSGMELANWYKADSTLYGHARTQEVYGTTYKLAFFGENHDEEATYTFPEGYHIMFFIASSDGEDYYYTGRFNYSLPEYNERLVEESGFYSHLDTNTDCPNYDSERGRIAATAWRSNGYTFFGFEDGAGDEDLNDIVFWAEGAYEADQDLVTLTDEEAEETVAEPQKYTFCYEDNFPVPGDYDFNDLVLAVSMEKYPAGTDLTDEDNVENDVIKVSVTIEAVGSTEQLAGCMRLKGCTSSMLQPEFKYEQQEFFGNPNISNSNYVPVNEASPTTYETMQSGSDQYIVLFNDAHYAISGIDSDTENYGTRLMYNTLEDKTNTKGDVVVEKTNVYKIIFDGSDHNTFDNFTVEDNLDIFIVETYNSIYFEVHTYEFKLDEVISGWNNYGVGEASAYEDNYPWAIAVPVDFKYPIEWTAIGTYNSSVLGGAYQTSGHSFGEWAADATQATDWYNYPTSGLVYE